MHARPAAKPEAFDEAVVWFRRRLPLTDQQFKVLEDASHARAFTIANVNQLQVVREVWEAIDEAIAQGTTFEDFKAAVSEKLTAAWGKANPALVETVFRNGVQTAYGRGRWLQQTDPEVTKARPFLKLSVILDLRSSKICPPLANTILPVDHPFWRFHWPPLHHNCRSTTVSLTREQALGQGIAGVPPTDPAADGFGQAPDVGEWQPDYTKYPARLAQEAQRKAAGGGFLPQVMPAPAAKP